MLNMTRNHGPTEFCNRSKQADILAIEEEINHAEMNQEEMDQGARKVKLAADFGAANAAVLEEHAEDLKCPHGYRRAPVTSPGDAVLFDFRTKHRVLPNKSNQTRACCIGGLAGSGTRTTTASRQGRSLLPVAND